MTDSDKVQLPYRVFYNPAEPMVTEVDRFDTEAAACEHARAIAHKYRARPVTVLRIDDQGVYRQILTVCIGEGYVGGETGIGIAAPPF